MRRVNLSQGAVTIIDDEDYEAVHGRTLYLGRNGYVYYSVWKHGRSRPDTLHALLMGAVPGSHIDHINGDKLDNRRSNLRVVSPQANQVNRRRLNRNNTSGVRGVAWTNASNRNPWRAQISVEGGTKHLGLFPTKEAAVAARKAAERRFFGEECPCAS